MVIHIWLGRLTRTLDPNFQISINTSNQHLGHVLRLDWLLCEHLQNAIAYVLASMHDTLEL